MNPANHLNQVLGMVGKSIQGKKNYCKCGALIHIESNRELCDPCFSAESELIGKRIFNRFHFGKIKQLFPNGVDAICEFCSDPIYSGAGRRYSGSFYYHDDEESNCFLESVKLKARNPEVILKAAESMSLDQRITA